MAVSTSVTGSVPFRGRVAELVARPSLRWFGLGLLVSSWVARVSSLAIGLGAFRWLGLDFGLYWAQALALKAGGGAALYNTEALGRQLQHLAAYTTAPSVPLAYGPVPYPPVFAWLFGVFDALPPVFGYAVWTALNLGAAVHLARRAASFFPLKDRRWVLAVVLTSFPLVYSLFVGQPTILLGCAMAEAFLALRQGESVRGGLWVAGLILKPQYGLVVGLVLLWKRQWQAAAAAAAGVLAVMMASLAVAGPAALFGYPQALQDLSTFNGQGTLAFPDQMINWRGMILRVAPTISDRGGVLLTLALGGLTLAALAYAWRGPWRPGSVHFDRQMALLAIATLIANYHSHTHGATILIVPLAAVLARCPIQLTTRIGVALMLLSAVAFVETGGVAVAAWPLSVGLVILFLSLLVSRPTTALA